MNKRFNRERRERAPLSFKEKLTQAIENKVGEHNLKIPSEEELEKISVIENGVRNSELEEFLEKYGVESHIELYEIAEGRKIYRLQVKNNFSDERIPPGYIYIGGPARSLLVRNLGIDVTYIPRDIDVARLAEKEPYEGADDAVAKEFMPDDFEHGNHIRHEKSVLNALNTRDLTLNEVVAIDDEVWFTEDCLKDTVRRIIRPTKFEKFSYNERGDLGPKMLSKILRFYTETIQRYDQVVIGGVEDYQFNNFISPFWLALQLDWAFEVNEELAEDFTKELIKRGQIPDDIRDAEEAARYLSEFLRDFEFNYRRAPEDQFDLEEEWFKENW